MPIMDKLFRDKGWLAYGSFVGGVFGALIMHLNEALNSHPQLTLDIQMSLTLAVALGMVGGILGGVIGSLISGRLAKENIVLNVGESLGIGLVDGFLSGTLTGIIMGLIHMWKPKFLSAGTLLIIMALVIAVAVLVFAIRRPRRRPGIDT
jgi:hypothetical protein